MKIEIDYRERNTGIIDILKAEEKNISVQKLKYGDFIVNQLVVIERKTAKDFNLSLIDGRLFSQLSRLKKSCLKPLMIIEGNPYKSNLLIHKNAIKGALVSITAIWNIPIIFSKSIKDTKDIILMIGRQWENMRKIPLRKGYKHRRIKSKQLFILQGLPDIGPIKAKRLLNHFGSVIRVLNSNGAELKKIKGIGNSLVRKIYEVLHTEI